MAASHDFATQDIIGYLEDNGIKLTELQFKALCVKISYWFAVGFAKGAHTFSELYTKRVKEMAEKMAEKKTKDLLERKPIIIPFNSIIKP